MLNSIIISMPYTKNNSRYSKNPPYNGFYSVLQHNNNYVVERTKEEKYMVKRRLKSVIAAVLVAAMLTTMAPQVVCKAAETAWEIVKNQDGVSEANSAAHVSTILNAAVIPYS